MSFIISLALLGDQPLNFSFHSVTPFPMPLVKKRIKTVLKVYIIIGHTALISVTSGPLSKEE